MTSPTHFVIVYQFGKVASTALVNTLNRHPDVEAHQSHFLGEDALKRIVVNATSPSLSPYFRKHMIGQLMANLELTTELKRVKTGRDGRKLTVISLSREPVSWFRSCIQQDIKGYEDGFTRLGQAASPNPEVALQAGVERMLADVSDLLEAQGGAAAVVNEIGARGGKDFLQRVGTQDEFLKTMLMLSLRPITWFEEHFRKCFGFSLEAIPPMGTFWLKQGHPDSYVILRYEDIASEFAAAMQALGVPMKGKLAEANLSRSKPFAEDIRAAFQSDAANRLRRSLQQTDYARFFGYEGLETTNDVAVAAG
ncbi:MAG: hypothetical protein AAF718_04610 [Pseudomonadota bacterium]